MYGGKRYGEAKIATCPFCGRGAYTKNAQGVPVCSDHTTSEIKNCVCACGKYLDLREGKWGPFFLCERCGPVNLTKALSAQKEAAMGGWKIQRPKSEGGAIGITGITSNASSSDANSIERKKAEFSPKQTRSNAPRANAWKDADGNDIYVRSDDPRFEFK